MSGRATRAHQAVRVVVRSEQEDEASGALWQLGPTGLEIQAECAPGQLPIVAYFPARAALVEDVRACLAELRPQSVEAVPVPDVDWAANFRQSFRGFEAGGFRVVPAWEPRPADLSRVLVVDPGRAFGTGTHETTRLCLQGVERLATQGALGRVLDVGTGTGILAIAALRCGARLAVGLDNDPESMDSARAHARLNRVALPLVLADGVAALRPTGFDVILANLMAPLLLRLRDDLASSAAPGGRLVLSGLLTSDVGELSAAYGAAGHVEVDTDGEWAALTVSPR